MLIPLTALLGMLALAAATAAPNNPNTDWFAKAGYGVFVHFLAKVQNHPACI